MITHKYILKCSYNAFQAFFFSFLFPPAKGKATASDLGDLMGSEWNF